MKFSAQEECGLRCLTAIGAKGPNGTMTIPELSENEGMSQPHVAKIMSLLKKSGYVTSTRGQIGGYALSRPAREVSVGQVLADMGGRLYDAGYCDRHTGVKEVCVHKEGNDCRLSLLWNRIQAAVDHATHNISLQDLIDGTVPEFANVTFVSNGVAHKNTLNGVVANKVPVQPPK